MGYLDKKSRVIDVVLTEFGRKLYAVGQLDFTYFALFDDLIDYDPRPASGTYSDADREYQIESTQVLQAPIIPDARGTTAPLEPTSHIFTAAPGYRVIPTMSSPIDGSVVELMADQRVLGDGGYRRTGTSLAQIDMALVGDADRGSSGFIVRVLASGSFGHRLLDPRSDLAGQRSYDPFIGATIDLEEQVERPTVTSPDSSRAFVQSISRK